MNKTIVQSQGLIIFFILQFFFVIYFLSQDGNNVVFFKKQKLNRHVISLSTFSTRIKFTAMKTIMLLHREQNADRIIVNVAMKHRNINISQVTCSRFNDCVNLPHIAEPESYLEILSYFESYFGIFQHVSCPHNHVRRKCYEKGAIFLQFLYDYDWGPGTKLLGALLIEKDPDTVIVTVDDDCHYYPDLIQKLAERVPPDSVLGTGDAWQNVALCKEDLMSEFYEAQKKFLFRLRIASVISDYENYGIQLQNSWLMGVAAVAYRVAYFSDDVFELANNLSPQCFINDDVWIAGYLQKRGIKYFVAFIRSIFYHHRHPTASVSVIPHSQDYDILSCAMSFGFFS